MNWDEVEGRWHQFKGQVRQRWGKLTDDDLEQTKGRRERLVGKIQERYGESKESAARRLDRFISEL